MARKNSDTGAAASTDQPARSSRAKGKKEKPVLFPVEDMAVKKKVKDWELAGMMRAVGWAEGKQLTEAEFDQAMKAFRSRPQGSGKITL